MNNAAKCTGPTMNVGPGRAFEAFNHNRLYSPPSTALVTLGLDPRVTSRAGPASRPKAVAIQLNEKVVYGNRFTLGKSISRGVPFQTESRPPAFGRRSTLTTRSMAIPFLAIQPWFPPSMKT